MLDVLFVILKMLWWLFSTTGFAAAMFCIASLIGYAAGQFRVKHPNWKRKRSTAACAVLWVMLLGLVCSIPILNWIIAIVVWTTDDDLVSELLKEAEFNYDFGEEM